MPPPFESGNFNQWRSWFEIFLQMNIKDWFISRKLFEASKGKNGRVLGKEKCTEEQLYNFSTNKKVIKLLINILANKILCE